MANWILAGASGLVGKALLEDLTKKGEQVRVLVRHAPRTAQELFWDPDQEILDPSVLENVDVVVCLSGASIAQRWTEKAKTEIVHSRVLTTKFLAQRIASQTRPIHFLHASATGFYGSCSEEICTEQSPSGSGFLAQTAIAWEQAAQALQASPHLVTALRLGVVLAPQGGALAKMWLPFSFGVGGPIGNGQQWFPWIHLEDVVEAIQHCVKQKLTGPVLVIAPQPVRQKEFASALGHCLQRPAFAPLPSFVVKLLFGEMGSEVLLAGQRCIPEVLKQTGFSWKFSDLKTSLEDIRQRKSSRH